MFAACGAARVGGAWIVIVACEVGSRGTFTCFAGVSKGTCISIVAVSEVWDTLASHVRVARIVGTGVVIVALKGLSDADTIFAMVGLCACRTI